MSLRDELAALHEKYGQLTPKLVVDEGRPKSSPLHGYFEWDDKVAGERFRQVQAAALIRSVKVEWVHGDEDDRVRAFHSITRADGVSYEPIERIVADDIAKATLLRQAEREWRQMYRRYRHLKEFVELVVSDVA